MLHQLYPDVFLLTCPQVRNSGLKENPEFPIHNETFLVPMMSGNTHEYNTSDITWMPVSPSPSYSIATILSMWWLLLHQQRPLTVYRKCKKLKVFAFYRDFSVLGHSKKIFGVYQINILFSITLYTNSEICFRNILKIWKNGCSSKILQREIWPCDLLLFYVPLNWDCEIVSLTCLCNAVLYAMQLSALWKLHINSVPLFNWLKCFSALTVVFL